ncbi:MAG: hypothetical protein RMK94_00595 [Armatimonadota bacterium]|nr:hypothetical protein [Armatimonadota bacterium]
MLTWAELIVVMFPLGLVGILLWLRLRTAGATEKVAAKLILLVLALFALALFGIFLASIGWKGRNDAMMVLGAAIGILGFIALRKSLKRIWERFPLTEESEPKDDF